MEHLQKSKNEEKFRETDDSRNIYQKESNKAFFQLDLTHDIAAIIINQQLADEKHKPTNTKL